MKFLKQLFGKQDEKPTTWDIKSPAERPQPRTLETDSMHSGPAVAPKKEPNPFLDDPMLDTMSLEIDSDDSTPGDPYQTNSWKLDPNSDTRKLKTIPFGQQTESTPKAPFNPYDTGKMRRGWKK
jgi:hypothetical protein